ncbi:MAG: hypothetical protein LBT88_08620 [Oscillospiraceae bacterium]|jgi:gas vesicle protein|nr:hypothetical protein [Oscillospiraceae bacterium]
MSGYYFLKGIGVGTAIGVAVGAIISPKHRKSSAKTVVGKAVRSFGEIVDSIASTVAS